MDLYPWLLGLHVATGSVALVCGFGALLTAKGGRWHRRAGTGFAWSMLLAGLSALSLSALRSNAFLFTIGIFSLYLLVSGWRAAVRRPWHPGVFDWLVWALMATTAVVMICVAGAIHAGMVEGQALVLLVFGVIALALVLGDWRKLRARELDGKARIMRHLSRMIPALIAATTAFTVTNAGFLPVLLQWLGPTIALAPAIVVWRRRVRTGGLPLA